MPHTFWTVLLNKWHGDCQLRADTAFIPNYSSTLPGAWVTGRHPKITFWGLNEKKNVQGLSRPYPVGGEISPRLESSLRNSLDSQRKICLSSLNLQNKEFTLNSTVYFVGFFGGGRDRVSLCSSGSPYRPGWPLPPNCWD